MQMKPDKVNFPLEVGNKQYFRETEMGLEQITPLWNTRQYFS